MSLLIWQDSRKKVTNKRMEDTTKIFDKLNDIEELLFVLLVVELRKSGLTQGNIAKILKTSKTTINNLLKDAGPEGE